MIHMLSICQRPTSITPAVASNDVTMTGARRACSSLSLMYPLAMMPTIPPIGIHAEVIVLVSTSVPKLSLTNIGPQRYREYRDNLTGKYAIASSHTLGVVSTSRINSHDPV